VSNHLIIFIKNPVLGSVKTRLAATVGAERALEVYGRLLSITREAAIGVQSERHLYYADTLELEDDWDSSSFQKRLQRGDDLGERMHSAFADAFAKGAAKAVIIGSDCPDITSELINQAFAALGDSDVVIGPAVDGGYYLLGMNGLHPAFFNNKQWSTSSVLSATMADAERSGLRVHLLPTLNDIDDESDLIRSGL
jgi:uncharacterized protein